MQDCVLDNGRIREYDSPNHVNQNPFCSNKKTRNTIVRTFADWWSISPRMRVILTGMAMSMPFSCSWRLWSSLSSSTSTSIAASPLVWGSGQPSSQPSIIRYSSQDYISGNNNSYKVHVHVCACIAIAYTCSCTVHVHAMFNYIIMYMYTLNILTCTSISACTMYFFSSILDSLTYNSYIMPISCTH